MRTIVEPYEDRQQAGQELAQALSRRKGSGALVLAVPRGGVVVGYEVAAALDMELDVIVPRKLRAPHEEELAIGAVASWGDHDVIVDEQSVRFLGVSREYIEREVGYQLSEVSRRLGAYRGTTDPPNVEGREVILVDDGIATGYTIRAAAVALRNLRAARVTLAVPVGPPDSVQTLQTHVDELVCLKTPSPFMAVGYWYRDFAQVSDEEVVRLLRNARSRQSGQ